MQTQHRILNAAVAQLQALRGQTLDVLTIMPPVDVDEARHLVNVISKLSPFVANMIEYHGVRLLNTTAQAGGQWQRQDPAFPDAIYNSPLNPPPGIEIKTWFPLATEITARFRESSRHFDNDQTRIAMIAWLPAFVIYGKPVILDVWTESARTLAHTRDAHYHQPPDYLVLEPEDTRQRTVNLRQTITNGYKFQGTVQEREQAMQIVSSWGDDGRIYQSTPSYQRQLRALMAQFKYRLDTNYAKLDRIQHDGLEAFKYRVLDMAWRGLRIRDWAQRGYLESDAGLQHVLSLSQSD